MVHSPQLLERREPLARGGLSGRFPDEPRVVLERPEFE